MEYPCYQFSCLNCGQELTRRAGEAGFLYRCNSCHSHAASIPLLRKVLPAVLVNRLWVAAAQTSVGKGRDCPLCSRAMAAPISHQGHVLDLCRSCRLVWFDPGDYPGDPAELEASFQCNELSPKARQALALAQAELIRERADAEERRDNLRNSILRGAGRSAFRSFFRF